MSPLPGLSAALTYTIMHGSVGYLVWTICYLVRPLSVFPRTESIVMSLFTFS